MNTRAQAIQAVAREFAPDWQYPPGMPCSLPEYALLSFWNLDVEPLRAMRRVWSDRLEAIEDGTYYTRPALGFDGWATWGPEGVGAQSQRFKLDRQHAYAMLWHIDALIRVHTAPRSEDRRIQHALDLRDVKVPS